MKFGVIVEKDEDGYFVASVPELPRPKLLMRL
jgi:predicted RNase H-like HicB family nuclease